VDAGSTEEAQSARGRQVRLVMFHAAAICALGIVLLASLPSLSYEIGCYGGDIQWRFRVGASCLILAPYVGFVAFPVLYQRPAEIKIWAAFWLAVGASVATGFAWFLWDDPYERPAEALVFGLPLSVFLVSLFFWKSRTGKLRGYVLGIATCVALLLLFAAWAGSGYCD
jgi:hypothetical protein